MLELIILTAFIIFTLGLLAGVRCQEINLRRREQRLSAERRRVNAQICAINAHQADCLISAVTAGIGARLAIGNATGFPMLELIAQEWPRAVGNRVDGHHREIYR